MAKNIEQKFSVDLGAVVDSAISTTKAIRKSNQATKEAEFQRAVANGLSYEEQLKLRKAQLEEEKSSSFSDPDYIASLEKSITDTSKLSRFNTYRTKYATTLASLNAGKINERTYLETLKSSLEGITDPELRLEIQNDIVAGEQKLKTYNDTILSNHVKRAKYDGTKTVLQETIAEVNAARAKALINDNQDEVSALDETLSALNSQFASVKIEDSITDFQVTSATRGSTAMDKLNLINNQISQADPSTPIKVGDRTYTSAQQFWNLERDNFLAGNSQIFGNFFNDLNTEVKNKVAVDAIKHGYPTQSALDEAMQIFTSLKAKPEITPYINRLDTVQASVMGEAVDNLSKAIVEIGTNNLEFKEADVQLQNIAMKYGVNTDSYRTKIGNELVNAQKREDVTPAEAKTMEPAFSGATLPKIDAGKTTAEPTPAAPVVTTATPVQPKAPVDTTATQTTTTTSQPPTVVTTSTAKPAVTPTQPASTPVQPVAQDTAVPPKPVQYTGSSIVDYLKANNQDTSLESRAKLAVEQGIVKSADEYLNAAKVGQNAEMNTKLLDTLRKKNTA